MTKSQSISPLRQRMLDDMRMRTLKPSTQAGYLRAVVRLTRFLKNAHRIQQRPKIYAISSCTWSMPG
jgi:hypothetical protein